MHMINNQIDKKEYKRLSSTKIVNWLMYKGYINKEKIQIIKEVYQYNATSEGEKVGIISEELIDEKTGQVTYSYLLSQEAQKYILNELGNIISNSKQYTTSKIRKKERINVGARWTEEEEQQLIDEYVNQKLTITQIAKIHLRKYAGIKIRLRSLGLLED